MNKNHKATPGKAWRASSDGILLEMPSSTPEQPHWARLRSVDMGLLIRLGRIPDSLTALIAQAVKHGGALTLDLESMSGVQRMLELADAVCEVSFVEPKIVENPQADDEISLNDLTLEDKLFVLSFFQKPVHELERFRDQQARDVEPVQSGQADANPAEPDREPVGVGEPQV